MDDVVICKSVDDLLIGGLAKVPVELTDSIKI